jgi:hypothetical protein
MHLNDDYIVIGPNGQHINCGSLDGIMKVPILAEGILNMAGNAVGATWQGFEHKTTEAILSLRAHGKINKVEDIVIVFIDELFKALTPFHNLYAKAFECEPIDYAEITNMRIDIAQMRNKFLPGLPATKMIHTFISMMPNTLGLNVIELGTAYQALMFFQDKAKRAATFPVAQLEASRENFLHVSHESWEQLLTNVSTTCKIAIPTEIDQRTKTECREFDRLVREGVERTHACDEALKVARQVGSKDAFNGWLDKEFGIDTETHMK